VGATMTIIDHYIFHILVFSPLVASIFITLIPAIDTGSKRSLSRFFAIIGLLVFIRVFISFLSNKIPIETGISFSVANFNINLNLLLNKYNIFLYGAAAMVLMATMSSYIINDTKTNIHQASPFLLTFFLYISFGQTDLRVALPILSIANFLIYFLIGSTDKTRRGSTIFQMGIFLFSCDTMVLVLLQISYSDYLSSTSFAFFNFLLLIPGLARLCLPMLAPFMKKLLLNVDDAEGPFLITFLQFAGIWILILNKTDLAELPHLLTTMLTCIATIGSIYVALLAITDHQIRAIPYYFLVFYSSLGSMFLFLSNSDDIWFFSISLLITNIACFFHATRCALLIEKYRFPEIHHPQVRSIWFIALGLFLVLPGMGIGMSLLPVVYQFITLVYFGNMYSPTGFWLLISIGWILGLLLFSFAFILSVRELVSSGLNADTISVSNHLPILRSLLRATILVILFSWLIPLATFYIATLGPK
jgi:hypothetical protein